MTKLISNRKSEVITFRATIEQKTQLVAKAAASDMSLSEYILSLGESAKTVESAMTSEMLEARLGLSGCTLDLLYIEVNTDYLKNKTAKALATLDPDGLEWYAQRTQDGNVWTNELYVYTANPHNKTLRKLMNAIFNEDDIARGRAVAVYKEPVAVAVIPEHKAVAVYTEPEPTVATVVYTEPEPIAIVVEPEILLDNRPGFILITMNDGSQVYKPWIDPSTLPDDEDEDWVDGIASDDNCDYDYENDPVYKAQIARQLLKRV